MGGIIESVYKVQRESKDDAKQDDGFHTGHAWLIAMSCSACPTSLHFSMTLANPS